MYYDLVFICVYIQNRYKVTNIKQGSLSQIELGIRGCSMDLFIQHYKRIYNSSDKSTVYFLLLASESDGRGSEHDPN